MPDQADLWSETIGPIVQEHCQGCHHPGDIAPFPLVTYDDAYRLLQKILRAVDRRKMPPWKPVSGFGEFLDARGLSDGDVASIRDWVAAGAPEGPQQKAAPAHRGQRHGRWAHRMWSWRPTPMRCRPATGMSTAAS
jgi:hypothetical protein